eukprot:COSAG01_NODE_9303_length_2489_cov_2.158159_1_plen_94_part_10
MLTNPDFVQPSARLAAAPDTASATSLRPDVLFHEARSRVIYWDSCKGGLEIVDQVFLLCLRAAEGVAVLAGAELDAVVGQPSGINELSSIETCS